MNWQKITIWSLLVVVLFLILGYFVWYKFDVFCYPEHFECVSLLRFGFALTVIQIFKYTIFPLFLILILPIRYKKSAYIGFFLVFVIINVFVFILPNECTGYMCFDKASGARFARNLYPLVLIPILVINFFRFRRQDKKLLLNK